MKRAAQPILSVEGQEALEQYARALRQVDDFTTVTIHNCVSDLCQFMAWCEDHWRQEQDEQPFTPQVISPPLLIRYRTYLQIMLWLKPSSVNRTLMSLKRYFTWATKMRVTQQVPTSIVKFVPKEAPVPRQLSDEEESALVAAVNLTGTLRDRTIITLLLHTRLRARELCTVTYKQVHLSRLGDRRMYLQKREASHGTRATPRARKPAVVW